MAMVKTLYRLFDTLKYTPLHPQWIANRFHLRKLELLSNRAGAGLYVDIGAGKDASASLLKGAQLVTVDYPQTSVAYGAKPDIYADVQSLPLADDSVDGVIFFEVLEHVPNDERAVAEIARTLRKDGLMFITAPFVYPLHDAPHDYKRFSHYGLPMLLEQHDLRILETHFHGNSLTTAIQLTNLAILDAVKALAARWPLAALLSLAPAYAMCLLGNLLSVPVMKLNTPNALVLGQTIIARKSIDAGG